MTPDRALKVMNWSVAALIAAAAAVWLASCAGLWSSVRASAMPAGGAAAGALAGSVVGPAGTVVGAGVGAVVGHSVGENAELREGTLQGEGAGDKENEHLKALLMLSQGELQVKERSLQLLEQSTSWTRTWAVRILLAGLVTRNLHNFPQLIKALLAKRWSLAARWAFHILIWPKRPEAISA
jgi:osmotically inducible lipoprotein OsmB